MQFVPFDPNSLADRKLALSIASYEAKRERTNARAQKRITTSYRAPYCAACHASLYHGMPKVPRAYARTLPTTATHDYCIVCHKELPMD